MSFKIFTDSAANLPSSVLVERDIYFITMMYTLPDGSEHPCQEPDRDLDTDEFFEDLRKNHTHVRTSMINSAQFFDAFEPHCAAGSDVLYISLSSGISGTHAAACAAAEELMEKYPVKVCVIDSLGAGLGEGLLVLEAADLRDEGATAEETAARINELKLYMCQRFMVDDLVALRRGGRLSGGAAIVGTLMNIKPILMGDGEGKIVCISKERGRARAIKTLADLFEKQVADAGSQTIGILHSACRGDAEALADMLRERSSEELHFMICDYDPGTGSHLGAGALALFFFGEDARVAEISGKRWDVGEIAQNAASGAMKKLRSAAHGAGSAIRTGANAIRTGAQAARAAVREAHEDVPADEE